MREADETALAIIREGDLITFGGVYAPEPWWRPIRRWLGWPTPTRHPQMYVVTKTVGGPYVVGIADYEAVRQG